MAGRVSWDVKLPRRVDYTSGYSFTLGVSEVADGPLFTNHTHGFISMEK